MNISGLIGVTASLVVFIIAVSTSTASKEVFLNEHAILIVLGGTVAATLLCFPIKTLLTLFKVFTQKILGRYTQAHDLAIREIVDISLGLRDDSEYIEKKLPHLKTPFLKEALELEVEGGIEPRMIDEILERRASTHSQRYEKEASIFKVIGKFPPAFGLMGTTLAMISLLQGIGSENSFKTLGPSMAIGLVATFYGIAITNLIFIPMGENLSKLNEEDETLRQIVMDGVKLLRTEEHPLIVEEVLKSFLLPSERSKIDREAA